MAEQDFSVFKKFSDARRAQEVARVFNQHNIEVRLVDNSPAVDLTFTGNTLLNQVELKLLPADFARARKVLEEQVEVDLEEVDESYYLLAFSNEELLEVLLKSDEWGEFDYLLAKKILKDRGLEVNEDLISSLKKQRIQDLAKPEEGQRPWILVGYLLSFIGGFLGIFIGWFLWTQKKTLPNGDKVYTYSEGDRKHGRNMFVIGLIIFPIVFGLRLLADI